jgi:mycofactocin system glycosyltransferase
MTALPEGFGLTLSASVRRYGGGRVLAGGMPFRVLRLSNSGLRAIEALEAGRPVSLAARELGGRLVDSGLASPRPGQPVSAPAATVVIPVRDRFNQLERCLRSVHGPKIVVVDDGSAQPEPLRALCSRHGARYMRRARGGGPAAARNAALAAVGTELVAFVDSDCAAQPGWLGQLATHFADPTVGAVAPRVVPDVAPGPPTARRHGVRERFAAVRSPLDLGAAASEVAPGRPVPYVPAAALVARTAAVAGGFDKKLRYGEDVDLVWRLCRAGWTVRYDPSVVVTHEEPDSWRGLLLRRYRYGTSAAALSVRHPGRLAPAIVRTRTVAAAALAFGGRPGAAIALALDAPLRARHRLRDAGVPARAILALRLTATWRALLGLGRAATTLAAPALIAGLTVRRTRAAAAVLLTAAPLSEWVVRRPGVDPLRWTAAAIMDDIAYGAGVWRGCVKWRTAGPLRPRFARSGAST